MYIIILYVHRGGSRIFIMVGSWILKSHPGIQLSVAGKARHKLGGSGGKENFGLSCHQFWYSLRAFYTYNYSLVSDIFEGEVNHIIAKVMGMSCTINWMALQIEIVLPRSVCKTMQDFVK